MSGTTILFYMLGLLTLASAVLAVSSRYIFRAAVFLFFTLIGVSGLYFWMHYEFIAAVQIVVYVGGITVLIIFSVFLTQQAGEKMVRQKTGPKIFSALAIFCGYALVMIQVCKHDFLPPVDFPLVPDVETIGNYLFVVGKGGLALPFEIVSMLLLAALIGSIVIAVPSVYTKTSKSIGEKFKAKI